MSRFGKALTRFWENKIHFLELHYLYILFLIFFFSGLYYCQPGTNWNYIDALFMATTGSTDTGLNTIPMSEMSTYHMLVLYFSSFLGSHVTVSFVVVMVRRYYFSKRFEQVLQYNKKRKEEYKRQKQLREQQMAEQQSDNHSLFTKRSSSLIIFPPVRRRLSIQSTPVQPSSHHLFSSIFSSKKRRTSFDSQITNRNDLPNFNKESSSDEHSSIEMENYDELKPPQESAHPYDASFESDNPKTVSMVEHSTPNNNNNQQITFSEDTNVLRERERRKLLQHRNNEEFDQLPLHRTNSEYEIMRQPSAKHELTKNERDRMGGTEYRALEMLAKLVPIYYLGFIIVFGFLFRIYVAASPYAQEVLATSNPTGPVEPWFFSFFMSLSAFTNLGLNHLDASMAPFQNAPAPLILSIILILAGNTAFAILMRFIIWCCYVATPRKNILRRETLRYLLDHPRRCYTTLFPSTQTWWLLIVLVAITLVELICFLALNYWLPVLDGISWGSRFLDGLFQSVATRNGKVLIIVIYVFLSHLFVYHSWI